MFSDFRRTFRLTPEEKEQDRRRYKKMIEDMYQNKKCCTCIYYEDEPDAPSLSYVLPSCTKCPTKEYCEYLPGQYPEW